MSRQRSPLATVELDAAIAGDVHIRRRIQSTSAMAGNQKPDHSVISCERDSSSSRPATYVDNYHTHSSGDEHFSTCYQQASDGARPQCQELAASPRPQDPRSEVKRSRQTTTPQPTSGRRSEAPAEAAPKSRNERSRDALYVGGKERAPLPGEGAAGF